MMYDSYCLSNCYSVLERGANRSSPDAPDAGEQAPMYGGWRWSDLRLIRSFDGGPEEVS